MLQAVDHFQAPKIHPCKIIQSRDFRLIKKKKKNYKQDVTGSMENNNLKEGTAKVGQGLA